MTPFAAIKSVLTSTLTAVPGGAAPVHEARGNLDGTLAVTAPGSRDRGARRIVCGDPPGMPRASCYTADHYASFPKIVE